MKKIKTFIIIITALTTLFASTLLISCDDKFTENSPEIAGREGDSEEPEIVRSVEELDLIVAEMCESVSTSTVARLDNINVWRNLEDYYRSQPDILVKRGLEELGIVYIERDDYLEATLNPEYAIYMKVAAAYKTRDVSNLTEEEKAVYYKAVEIVEDFLIGAVTIFDKELIIHDYLARNIEYDFDYDDNDAAFDVYGALIGGKAVCQGYAQSFKMLMNMAGVECQIVTGTADGINHAWNLVNINGDWYHVDATWNDKDDVRSYQYFNVSDAIISKEHIWNARNYPPATKTGYNYYKYLGKTASNKKELEAAFAKAYNSGERTVEILCEYDFTTADLDFVMEYSESPMYSQSEYNGGILVAIIV